MIDLTPLFLHSFARIILGWSIVVLCISCFAASDSRIDFPPVWDRCSGEVPALASPATLPNVPWATLKSGASDILLVFRFAGKQTPHAGRVGGILFFSGVPLNGTWSAETAKHDLLKIRLTNGKLFYYEDLNFLKKTTSGDQNKGPPPWSQLPNGNYVRFNSRPVFEQKLGACEPFVRYVETVDPEGKVVWSKFVFGKLPADKPYFIGSCTPKEDPLRGNLHHIVGNDAYILADATILIRAERCIVRLKPESGLTESKNPRVGVVDVEEVIGFKRRHEKLFLNQEMWNTNDGINRWLHEIEALAERELFIPHGKN